jgi:manganese transport protein
MYAPAIGRASLTERTVLAGREVFLGRRRGPLAMLPFVGPAVIASIAYMDPGNFATNIQAGAKYGYELLWVALSANLVAMLFQALSAKVGIATGRNLAELCREHFAAPVVYAMWGASEIAAVATELAELLAQASGSHCCAAYPCSPACSSSVSQLMRRLGYSAGVSGMSRF